MVGLHAALAATAERGAADAATVVGAENKTWEPYAPETSEDLFGYIEPSQRNK